MEAKRKSIFGFLKISLPLLIDGFFIESVIHWISTDFRNQELQLFVDELELLISNES